MIKNIFNVRICQNNIFKNVLLRKMNNITQTKPIESSIRKKLKESLDPYFIDVINESYMHNVPKGSETHFKVIVISDQFNNKPLLTRHRMVHDLLKLELQHDVHALSIVAKTPEQWEDSDKTLTSSPACRGGFGK